MPSRDRPFGFAQDAPRTGAELARGLLTHSPGWRRHFGDGAGRHLAACGMCTSANDVKIGQLHEQPCAKFGALRMPPAGSRLFVQPDRMPRRKVCRPVANSK